MISAESFWTHSLHAAPQGESITRILAAAIHAVEPGEAVKRSVSRNGNILSVVGRNHDLSAYGHIHLLGIGKASVGMAEALAFLIGPQLTDGLIITKHPPAISLSPFTIIQGGHPVPDERSLFAGMKAVELISSLHPDDLLFCVISGGGSALMTAPAEGVSLTDMQSLTSRLLACGARINEINLLRRHLDRVKGGGLVKLANGATVVSLILSDVVGNPLEAIASGPTAPDPTTKAEALTVIEKYGLTDKIPRSIQAELETSSETPKPGDRLFDNVQNFIIGSNLQAAQAALRQAGLEGYQPCLLRADLQGEARMAAFELSTFLRQASQTGDPVPRPACMVVGGETTVTLKGQGKGGRNTELALAAVSELANFPGVMLVTLATDGEDGPTEAAGAVVTGETYRRAAGLGLNGCDYLDRNDSYSFFSALGDLLSPGPTGTNVNDLVFLFAF
jgi:glycerate 2-kinase